MGLFILDTSTFPASGVIYMETPIEDRGRGIQISWSQDEVGADFEHLGYSVRFAAAEPEAKDTGA